MSDHPREGQPVAKSGEDAELGGPEGDSRLNELPSIRTHSDDRSTYRRSNRAEIPKQSNFNGILVFIIFLMVVVMGVGGYILYQVQMKLDESNVLLGKSQRSIQELEDRLSATGTDVSLTLQSMQEQLGTNVSEIDKLWAVAYRQNRPKIEALEKSLDTTVVELNAQLDPIASTVGGVGDRFGSLNKEMVGLKKTLAIENDDHATQIALLRKQLQDQVDAFEKSRRKLDLVSQQLGDAREDIRSNLEYRARNNTDMLEMKRQIQTLKTVPVL